MQILEVSIQTDDLPETENFYSNLLDLKTKNKDQNSISYLAGTSTLTFIKSLTKAPAYHFAFNIPANKLDEAIDWVSIKTELIRITDNEVIAHFDNWNAKSIYFFDNRGNILEFIVRFDLDNPSDKPFNSESILSLNEIGVVTDQPLAFAESLIQNYGLEYFWRGPKREDFVAVGDDHGLFVIAIPNRNWYPTECPAEKHALKIQFMTNGVTKQITVNEQGDT
jgi:catechol-2,3-dioxygenase